MQQDVTLARSRIGRYVGLEPLGRGAMGTVYRAHDPELDRVVAIKVLADVSPAFVARFRREAQAIAKLTHPHVVRVFDVGVDDGGAPYFVMELLTGRPLDALLRAEGRLDVPTALGYADQAAGALAAAHKAGIIHRDIKPGNLVLDADGQIKVVDFGIARVADHGPAPLTNAATLMGTPGYMAPEQARGKPVDARADIYSLGVTLHEMVSGQRPFAAPDAIAVLVRSLEERLPDLRVAGISDDTATLIERMTAKDPEERPATMDEVRQAMQALLRKPRFAAGSLPQAAEIGTSPTEALVVPATLPTGLAPRRKRRWLALVPVIAGAGVGLWLLRPAPTVVKNTAVPAVVADAAPAARTGQGQKTGPLRVAVLKFKNLSGDGALDMLEHGVAETAVSELATRIPGVTVLERNDLESNITEIDRAGDLHFDPATVAKMGKLEGIEIAVVGGIQQAGGEVRITARLVRVENGEVLGSLTHTGKGSLFDAQDEVARLLEAKLRDLAGKEGRP